MAIVIRPFTEDLIPAVKEFNLRLGSGGQSSEFPFPEDPVSKWLPKNNKANTYQEFFLAVEGDAVRGGYILRHQRFSIHGKILPVAFYELPISEGMVNRKYVSVGVQMLREASKTQPLLFGLGMGGYDRPLPRMLKALGWRLSLVPFFFKVVHAKRFLREIRPLRKTPFLRGLMDFAAFTGAGEVGIRILQALRTRHRRYDPSFAVQCVGVFSDWADDVWEKSQSAYTMISVRDRESLSVLYPEERMGALRLKISRGGEVVGWAVVINGRMGRNKYFGNLQVGTIADYLAQPKNETGIILAATKKLEEDGADLIICSESSANWIEALRRAGFMRGPSNIVFATSGKLSELLQPDESHNPNLHLNFGDGDGPFDLYR